MPTVINRVPAGLLALLGSKVGGVNPAQLTEFVQPVIDFSEFYLADGQTRRVDAGNLAAVGPFASTIIVPQTELWVVDQYTISAGAALGAGQTLQFAPAYMFNLAGSTRALQVGLTSGALTVGDLPSAFAGPFILGPGTTLGCIVQRIVAGPVNAVLFSVQYTPLLV